MSGKIKFLILELDFTGNFKEAEAIAEQAELAGKGQVEVIVRQCSQEQELWEAVKETSPDWLQIVATSDRRRLLITVEERIVAWLNKRELLKNLQTLAPNLRLVGLNAQLDAKDLDSFSSLYALVGMQAGYNPIAMRQFAPRFYGSLAGGLALGAAFKAAFAKVQKEVLEHGGAPTMGFNHAIDPESFVFLPASEATVH